jgi:hypothetical protein
MSHVSNLLDLSLLANLSPTVLVRNSSEPEFEAIS